MGKHHDKDKVNGKDPQRDERVDETSEESFPASDSPSWTPIDRTGKPEEDEEE